MGFLARYDIAGVKQFNLPPTIILIHDGVAGSRLFDSPEEETAKSYTEKVICELASKGLLGKSGDDGFQWLVAITWPDHRELMGRTVDFAGYKGVDLSKWPEGNPDSYKWINREGVFVPQDKPLSYAHTCGEGDRIVGAIESSRKLSKYGSLEEWMTECDDYPGAKDLRPKKRESIGF